MRYIFLLVFAAVLHAADEVPDWVRQAASQQVTSYPAKVSSIVLLQEETVNVDPDGRRVMREREAIKILQRGGESIVARRAYNTKSGRIRDFQGWLIPPTGKPVPYAKNRVLDVAVSRDSVYDEVRMKLLECGSAPVGSVFAWEVTEEDRTVFTQDTHAFQDESPVLASRFVLTLPSGWEARGTVFNHDHFEPQVSGATYTWELRNLPWIEQEDYSPSLAMRAPWVAVSYYPPSDNRAGLQPLKDWPAVSTWLSRLVDPAAEVTDAVRVKAQQLTANTSGELEKIQAIAAFTQQTNYVEIALNLTKGGGYTPHRADETLAKNYGDCKDKSTLMRALLKAAGIESYVTTIYSGDRNFVRAEWASPMQFNHAIIAIRVSDTISLPTVFEVPALGRLLMFDPTDPITPLGDLPQTEQGSRALVLAGDRGALLTMPLLPPSANRIESEVDAALDSGGHIQARLGRQYFGQSGRGLLAVTRLRGSDELKRRLERTFSRRLGAITLNELVTEDRPGDHRFLVHLDLTADHFAQIMQNRLLVVRPGILSSGGEYIFTSKQRNSPVEFDSSMRRDRVRIKIPAGFKADEVPAAAKIESQYGTIEAHWTVQGDEIVFDQTLEIRNMIAPVSEYAGVRDFFDQLNGALAAPVVLVKQ